MAPRPSSTQASSTQQRQVEAVKDVVAADAQCDEHDPMVLMNSTASASCVPRRSTSHLPPLSIVVVVSPEQPSCFRR